MAKKIVYQTLEDRGNPDQIETDGPFICKWDKAWLGKGYYFWDTFISNAHWWGEEGAKYTKGYIICRAECDFNTFDCFDLVGETEHIQYFNKAIELMKEKGLYNSQTTVARVIYHWKDVIGVFGYEAIRAYGVNCKSSGSKFNSMISFVMGKPQYLDLAPAIQLCFFKKRNMNLSNFKIVYPAEYMEGYGI